VNISTLDALNQNLGGSVRKISVNDLSTILKLTAGIRKLGSESNNVRRWAATAGNLGSVELYVVACAVDGLPNGAYFYQAEDHSLSVLDWPGVLDAVGLMKSIMPGQSPLPDLLVVFTGAFHRISQKYGPFGYRLVQLDAGAAVSQSKIIAQALGIHSQIATVWPDDTIESRLRLEALDEQVTSVVGFYGLDTATSLVPSCIRTRGSAVSSKPIGEFREATIEQTLSMLYRESRMVADNLQLERSSSEARIAVTGSLASEHDVVLPGSAHGGTSLNAVLSERASVQTYSPDSILQTQLGTMLHSAQRGDVCDWPQDQGHVDLKFLVLANRVSGLTPGPWLFDPRRGILEPWNRTFDPGKSIELFVQGEFASAPVHLWVLGQLSSACTSAGALGHRRLLLRAGAAAHRAWFGAMAVGLRGSIVAGLVPGAAREHLGIDGYKLAALVGVAAGF
jgi:SagB-type dehydrogenase family enzyme